MGFFQGLKCNTGFHDWTDWSSKTSGSCAQTRRCKACKKRDNQNEHDWRRDVYVSETSCRTENVCRHCEKREGGRVAHKWGAAEWNELNPSTPCVQGRVCPRCGETETREVHSWGEWRSESPRSMVLVRFCRNCRDGRETKGPQPIFSIRTDDGLTSLAILTEMQNIAKTTRRKGEDDLIGDAKIMALGHRRCKLEFGHEPESPQPGEVDHYTWDWDEKLGRYQVVRWSGYRWTRL